MSRNRTKDPEIQALEEALKASRRENIALSRQLKEQQDKAKGLEKELAGARNVVSVLEMKIREQEMNFRMEQFLLYARKSERFSEAELDQMAKIVARLDEAPSPDMGISPEEQGDGEEDSSASQTSGEGSFQKEGDGASPERQGGKVWGRQPGTRTKGRNMEFSSRLEADERVLDLKAKPGIDPEYAASLKLIRVAEKHQIDFVPCHLRTRRTLTYLYSDASGKVVSLSPEEHDLIRGGKLTNRVIASTVCDKVLFGIPLNRSARMLNMMAGFNAVDAALLTSDYLKVASYLKPVYDAMVRLSRKGKVAHADETFLTVIHERESGGRRQGYMWAFLSDAPDKIATYTFYPSRSGECGSRHLEGAACSALQTDAYAVYSKVVGEMNRALAKQIEGSEGHAEAEEFLSEADGMMKKGIVLVGCAAHARRRFFRLMATTYSKMPDSEGCQTCSNVINMIAEIYSIERACRKRLASGAVTEEEFVAARKAEAGPVIAKLKAYASSRKEVHEHEPKLMEAIGYLLNQIDIIANYLDYPELTPDNNRMESKIRTVAVARAASMFASTSEGAEAWAMFLTILQTAEMNKVNPTEYLVHLMDRVAAFNHDEILEKDVNWEDLMPWKLKGKIRAISV